MSINQEKKQKINKIAKKYGLKLVLLFGSFANGKMHENSDMDIAVLSAKNIPFERYLNLTGELSKLFCKDVDLTILNEANPLLLSQVSKNSALLYGNKKSFAEFKLYAFHRYNDYLPYFKMERILNKKLVKHYAFR